MPPEPSQNNTESGEGTPQGKPDKVFYGRRGTRFEYNKKTARYARGRGAGIAAYQYSLDDPNADPKHITQADLDSWTPLERFAYRHHSLYFFLGVLISVVLIALALYSYLLTGNPFYGMIIFFIALYPGKKFCDILFLVEGQSIEP